MLKSNVQWTWLKALSSLHVNVQFVLLMGYCPKSGFTYINISQSNYFLYRDIMHEQRERCRFILDYLTDSLCESETALLEKLLECLCKAGFQRGMLRGITEEFQKLFFTVMLHRGHKQHTHQIQAQAGPTYFSSVCSDLHESSCVMCFSAYWVRFICVFLNSC